MATQSVSGDSGSTFSALKSLWPYMWPPDRRDLKLRLVWATVLLVFAKGVLVLVPYFFKWATDALAGDAGSTPQRRPFTNVFKGDHHKGGSDGYRQPANH